MFNNQQFSKITMLLFIAQFSRNLAVLNNINRHGYRTALKTILINADFLLRSLKIRFLTLLHARNEYGAERVWFCSIPLAFQFSFLQ